MFQKTVTSQIVFLIILFLLSSCHTSYNRLLKSDDYERMFQKSFEYYEDEDYVRAGTLFERVIPVYRGTREAARLNYYQASSFFKRGDYILASHHFDTFIRDFPNSEYTQDAFFMRAYCNYQLSPRPSLDQTPTRRAIDQFQMYIRRYPSSERVAEAQDYIEELREKLIEKSYISARLYFDMEDYRAAIVALKNSLKEYPETKYREDILFLILESSYLLARNSVPDRQIERYRATLEEYYVFSEEYPESGHLRDARRYYENSVEALEALTGEEYIVVNN